MNSKNKKKSLSFRLQNYYYMLYIIRHLSISLDGKIRPGNIGLLMKIIYFELQIDDIESFDIK